MMATMPTPMPVSVATDTLPPVTQAIAAADALMQSLCVPVPPLSIPVVSAVGRAGADLVYSAGATIYSHPSVAADLVLGASSSQRPPPHPPFEVPQSQDSALACGAAHVASVSTTPVPSTPVPLTGSLPVPDTNAAPLVPPHTPDTSAAPLVPQQMPADPVIVLQQLMSSPVGHLSLPSGSACETRPARPLDSHAPTFYPSGIRPAMAQGDSVPDHTAAELLHTLNTLQFMREVTASDPLLLHNLPQIDDRIASVINQQRQVRMARLRNLLATEVSSAIGINYRDLIRRLFTSMPRDDVNSTLPLPQNPELVWLCVPCGIYNPADISDCLGCMLPAPAQPVLSVSAPGQR